VNSNLLATSPEVFVSRYRLKTRGYLNAVSNRREFEGALIRVDGGYGCIHPWPELGDPTLEKCLADLSGPRRRPVVRRALRCAEYDRAGREFEGSLFEEMEVPSSHATLAKCDLEEISLAVEAGFTTVKLKLGRDLDADSSFLKNASTEFPNLSWRLDFNESMSTEQAMEFLTHLSAPVCAGIDFVEDPCPYAEGIWAELRKKTRLNFAVDREASPTSSAAQVMIIKPAVDEPFLLGETAIQYRQRVVLTSYMDHPVGQAFAAWEAARLELQFPGLVGLCGLQTHHLFEPDAFTEALGPWSPSFSAPQGTGIGFDDLLEEIPWTRLH
jgi:o-succinylbenzoate synthase